MIEVDVTHTLGRFVLDAQFRSGPGATVLFGRSGSGKTSLVNAIAGLIRPERGRIVVEGTVLLDTARGIFVPKHRRRLGYIFQESRLFPHLTVRQNLLFGRWFTPRAERRGSLAEIAALLGIEHLLDRRPGALSGGERQRVAIGRALLANPRLLLMDEPLASLDTHRKYEILPYVERLRDEMKIPIVYVSHEIAEVTRLATTMVLMSEGRVDAVGPVTDILGRLDLYPRTGRFEAGAVLEMQVAGHDRNYGLTTLRSAAGEIKVPRLESPDGATLRIHVRARDVIVAIAKPSGISALNVLSGRIAEIGPDRGAVRDIRIELTGASLLARITFRSLSELGLVPGREVFAIIKSVAIDRHSVGGGRNHRLASGFAEEIDESLDT
jgi:molybdate transport system ATP-binding protein